MASSESSSLSSLDDAAAMAAREGRRVRLGKRDSRSCCQRKFGGQFKMVKIMKCRTGVQTMA